MLSMYMVYLIIKRSINKQYKHIINNICFIANMQTNINGIKNKILEIN